jgi:hypothetical protein
MDERHHAKNEVQQNEGPKGLDDSLLLHSPPECTSRGIFQKGNSPGPDGESGNKGNAGFQPVPAWLAEPSLQNQREAHLL